MAAAQGMVGAYVSERADVMDSGVSMTGGGNERVLLRRLPDEFAVGSTFAGHVIRAIAGRGGMGVVYRAMHVPLKREVALKVIAPGASEEAEFRARFRREIEAAASIEHANVIPIYHAGEEEGLLFVTMRYVQGTDLARMIAHEDRLDPVRAVGYVAQIAAALDAAHERGVVHRDVKPANVLIEGRRAILTDFGLTKQLYSDDHVTEAGMLIGTFDYTPPEQLDGRGVDARSDVYALGCVLFQALTGRVPYPRESVAATLFAHLDAPPPSVTERVPDVPAELDDVVRRALAKDPADRFPTAGALAAAALAAVDAQAPEHRPSVVTASTIVEPSETAPAAGVPLPPALAGELGLAPFVGRAAALAELERRFALAQTGEASDGAGLRRGRHGQDPAGRRAGPARPRGRRNRALRALGHGIARALPAVHRCRAALHRPPRHARVPTRAGARARGAGTLRAGAAPPAAADARAARR